MFRVAKLSLQRCFALEMAIVSEDLAISEHLLISASEIIFENIVYERAFLIFFACESLTGGEILRNRTL